MNTQEKLEKIISLKKDLEKDLLVLIQGLEKKEEGVYFGKNVVTEPNIYFDTSEGLIFVDEGTKIKANSILRGPLIIGKNSMINSFAEISCSRIGNFCKVGGEFSESIIEEYSNKWHHGYLGNSYVGKWVNIGGGTSVSNLKNTYSVIKMKGEETGLLKLGAIIGDYSKTAINTSIFCGKVIGVSSHLYGTVTEDVPSFTSYVSTGNMYELPLEVAIKSQKAMASRRGVEFTKEDQEKFEKLYKDTAGDRQKAKVKKEKLKFN